MASGRLDEVRDYAFADQALGLRKRAGLTQRELAGLLRVSGQAIHAWEAGPSYPGTEHLKELIALYVERGALPAGREEAEAAALWATVRAKAARRTAPFDPAWFAALRPTPAEAAAIPPAATAGVGRQHDWGDAPAAAVVQGRAEELDTLARWVTAEGGRVVQVLGAGGIGKTTVAARLAYELAPAFAVVYWRSLRNVLPPEEWLAGAIAALSAGQTAAPDGFAAQLVLLVELLRAQRALLVLDNLETVLEPGAPAVRYRPGYEGYGAVLARLAESAQQGCLLLTSREQPLPADEAAVRALRLEGLGVEASRLLLSGKGLLGDEAAWQALVERYAGNPLALRIVGETIGTVFRCDTAAFLTQEVTVFGGIRQLLDEQVGRLSMLEQAILTWLAVEREPVGFADLVADLGPGVGRGEAVEAVEALRRRSLLEWGAGGTFTLQPVVLEDATARLVEACAQEILAGAPTLLVNQALLKAQAKDYVRRMQERLIAQPLLEHLRAHLGSAAAAEGQVLTLLGRWRGQPAAEQGYGPGNVVNLLRLLRGDLRGLDLAGLALRQAYLAEVEAQDASLARAHLAETVVAEAFTYPTSIALSADGALLAAGTLTGEAHLWRVADRSPLLVVQEHSGGVWAVALSADGRQLASAALDGTVRLWAAESGAWLRLLRSDRRYERLDITGLTGVTDAQRAALVALGAVEHGQATDAQQTASNAASLPVPTPSQESTGSPPTAHPRTNLTQARTSFVGRDAEVGALTQALASSTGTGARLLTLSGMAGCGKTRLALAAAEAVRDTYADGVWLVALASLPADPSPDPTAVAMATLAALSQREQPGQHPLDTLVAYLQAKRLLLVLDNCEHMVETCATLATRLLATCPELSILATSQVPLGSADETIRRVDTLAVPAFVAGTLAPEALHRLEQFGAIQLFVERAQAVQQGFVLSTQNAATVVTICRQLDGLPLALELAAARLHVLPVEELLTRLDDRFGLLRRGGRGQRGATDRYQTLQATLDWSYSLLDPAEQALLRRLAVFAGGWNLAAAEAVCAGEEVVPEAVLELLDELLERSLVTVSEVAGVPRYGLLETVRQYGLQRLDRADETGVVRDRHLHWCVTLAERAAPALLGQEQGTWLARLEGEHDNLRAALR